METYKKNYHLLEQWLESDFIVSEINNSIVQLYINFLSTNYSDKVITLNSRFKYARTLFYFAIECECCHNMSIQLIKCNQENKISLTKEDVQNLIAKPKKKPLQK